MTVILVKLNEKFTLMLGHKVENNLNPLCKQTVNALNFWELSSAPHMKVV